MTTTRTRLTAITLAALALTLTGCSGVTDALSNQAQGRYDSAADAKAAWATDAPFPDWLPEDAGNIRTVVSTKAALADVRVDTSGDLPASCEEGERRTYSTFAADWAPKELLPDRVQQCGDWSVIPVEGGYYGWTPSTPQTPTPTATDG